MITPKLPTHLNDSVSTTMPSSTNCWTATCEPSPFSHLPERGTEPHPYTALRNETTQWQSWSHTKEFCYCAVSPHEIAKVYSPEVTRIWCMQASSSYPKQRWIMITLKLRTHLNATASTTLPSSTNWWSATLLTQSL
jgi:hypothetical protein